MGRDLNLGPPEYKVVLLPTRPCVTHYLKDVSWGIYRMWCECQLCLNFKHYANVTNVSIVCVARAGLLRVCRLMKGQSAEFAHACTLLWNTHTHTHTHTHKINPLNAKLNPICHLLALLGTHHILHVSRIRVKQTYWNVTILHWYLWH